MCNRSRCRGERETPIERFGAGWAAGRMRVSGRAFPTHNAKPAREEEA